MEPAVPGAQPDPPTPVPWTAASPLPSQPAARQPVGAAGPPVHGFHPVLMRGPVPLPGLASLRGVSERTGAALPQKVPHGYRTGPSLFAFHPTIWENSISHLLS
jgi:hypothetical protein